MRWYDVALWSGWPPRASSVFPEYIGYVEAVTAFAAIERLMCCYKVACAAFAVARARDGSINYRCHKPVMALQGDA